MKPTWAKDFPMLYDMYCESKQSNKANYFAGFDEALRMPGAQTLYKQLEEDLKQLDGDAWNDLKRKACRCLTDKDDYDRYRELFDYLNEVKGYLSLKSEGCEEIKFITPEGNEKNPDLSARCGGAITLLEVKTINTSNCENEWIRDNPKKGEDGADQMQARKVCRGLSDGLRNKITSKLDEARNQLFSYSLEKVERRIVFLAINLDILFAADQRNIDELIGYIQQQSNYRIIRISCNYRRLDIILELTNDH
jgi:hypothetical protein